MTVRSIQAAVFAVVLLAAPAAAVDMAGWVTISADGAFTFKAPPGTVPYNDGGVPIDSLVGQYVHPKFKLMFDYGQYSNDLSGLRADPRYTVTNEIIDGRKAIIVTGPGENRWDCDHLIAMYMVVSHNWWNGRTTKLEINGCTRDPQAIPMLRQVFESIHFT